jgi:aminoglycoside 3-N-acetyltransferase I
MYLYDLEVDESYRRQGVGRDLIEKLKDYTKQINVTTIFVEAHKEDIEAIEFYKSVNGDVEDVCHLIFLLKSKL